MAPLKSLEQENPIIDQNFQAFCASHGIFSVEDFLLHDIFVLRAMAEERLKPESERLTEGIAKVLSIVDGQRQPWSNGVELLEDALHNKLGLSTGCDGIDGLLEGGFRKGQLTELVGPSSSGKTQICLQAASNVAKEHCGRVIYLDTSNSFSPQRITQFVGSNVMTNIVCHAVFDIFTMFNVLNQLEHNLRSQPLKGAHKVHLIIIDSISSLITPILGGGGSQGHALMVSAGFLLKKLAHEHNLAVLVTNHTVGGDGGVPKPALGETWKSIPHTRLLLSRDRGNTDCTLSIIKHSSMVPGKAASFMIRD